MDTSRWLVLLVVVCLFTASIPAWAQELELDGTYEDDLIVFNYPTDWFFCSCAPEEPILGMGNTEAVVKPAAMPQKGEVQLLIVKSVAAFLQTFGSTQSIDGLDAKGILQTFNHNSPLGIQAVAGTESYYFVSKNDLDALFLITPMEGKVFGMVIATSQHGSLDPFIDTVLKIGTSLHLPELENFVIPTDLDETYRGRGVRFDYPTDWIVQSSGEALMVVNDERILAMNEFGNLRNGQFLIFIYPTLDSLIAEAGYPKDFRSNSQTVAEFFAALAYRTYTRNVDVDFPEIDGRAAVVDIMEGADHERMMLTIDSQDGDDVSTMAVYGALDSLEPLRDIMMEMLGTIESR